MTETRPKGRPQTGGGETEKATVKSHGVSETAKQDRKTGTWDTDDVLITHDGTKQTHSESIHPNTIGRQNTGLKPVAVNKEVGN